jgi:hypothetical protein
MDEYTALYEHIMSTYEARLKSGSIVDHNFPEVKFVCKKSTQHSINPVLPSKTKNS